MSASSLIDSRVGISFIQITPRIFFSFLCSSVFGSTLFHDFNLRDLWLLAKRQLSLSSWFRHCTMNLHYRRKSLCMVGCLCKMKNTRFDFFPLFLFVGCVFYTWLCSKSRNALYNQIQAHAHKSIHWKGQHICIQQFRADWNLQSTTKTKLWGYPG